MEIDKNKRSIYLDAIRVLACFMVIAMHAPLSSAESANHGAFLVANGYFNSPCVPLFFMTSGALLLPLKREEDTFIYLKNRIGKVIYPTLSFSLFYYVLILFYGKYSNVNDAVVSLLSLPFSQVTPVLWFMYVLIGLYLLIPILSPWLRNSSKKELQFYMSLWFITQLYPWISLVLNIDSTSTGILYYLSGFIGYFILGYYMFHYDISLRILLFISIVLIPLPLFIKVYQINIPHEAYNSFLSFPPTIFTMTCFMILKKYGDKILTQYGDSISLISKLSFGIYLWHIFVRYFFLDKITLITQIDNYYLQYFIVLVLTFSISLILSYITSMLPVSKYLIGYRMATNINMSSK